MSHKLKQSVDIARQYFQSGNFQQAEIICRQILKEEPDHSYILHLLGLIEYQKTRYDDAIFYVNKAIDINPHEYFYYYNLAKILESKGLIDEAIEKYQKALMLKPDYAGAYNNLGNLLRDKKMIDEAIGCYQKALMLKPDYAGAYNKLGNLLRDKKMIDEAIGCYQKALMLKPDCAGAYNNLGNVLEEKGMFDEAIEKYQKALMFNPEDAEVYNNLGNAVRGKGMIDEAIEYYRKALMLRPDFAMAYSNLGLTFADKGRIVEAIENYEKAISLKPDADNHMGLGLVYLLSKDFENGWNEYEWRLQTDNKVLLPLMKPKWDGSFLKRKTILVCAEQGYGDTIQFVRYLPLLYKEYGAKKVLFKLNQKGLENLLRENEDILNAEILDSSVPEETLEYDTNIYLLSLPRIFKTNLNNIPFKGKRYLKANTEKVEWYRERYFNSLLVTRHSSLKVGIFWQGNPTFTLAKDKALPLSYFYPIATVPNIKVYSLQKGYGIEQLNNLPEGIEIVNLGETFNNFSDTAAAIENLDLVITIDSAVAHLSGALGKKTWILLPSFAEWRWHLDMDYSPWYEDVRLFRHKEMGKKNWEEMMERVKKQVEIEVEKKAG